MNVRDKIYSGHYAYKGRQLARQEEKRLKALFKADCLKEVGLEWHSQCLLSNAIFDRAWDQGHHSGYAEVLDSLEDLVGFLRKIKVVSDSMSQHDKNERRNLPKHDIFRTNDVGRMAAAWQALPEAYKADDCLEFWWDDNVFFCRPLSTDALGAWLAFFNTDSNQWE